MPPSFPTNGALKRNSHFSPTSRTCPSDSYPISSYRPAEPHPFKSTIRDSNLECTRDLYGCKTAIADQGEEFVYEQYEHDTIFREPKRSYYSTKSSTNSGRLANTNNPNTFNVDSDLDIPLSYGVCTDYTVIPSAFKTSIPSSSTPETVNDLIIDSPSSYDIGYDPGISHIGNPLGFVGIGHWVDERLLQSFDKISSKDIPFVAHLLKRHVQVALRNFEEDFCDAEENDPGMYSYNTQRGRL